MAAAKIKNTWEYKEKQANNCKEMNKALIERFLSLLDNHYHIKFTREFIKNQSVPFKEVFIYYTEQYGSTDGDNQLENQQRMLAEWHPSQRFHIQVNQLKEGLLNGSMIGAPIDNKRTVNIRLKCTKQCGLFSTAYGEWIAKDDQSFKQFKTFWKLKYDLLRKTTQAVGQYSYGSNAMQDEDE